MSVESLRIGEAAVRAGATTRTLRYYEQIGLLSPSARSSGGERRYGAEELRRLERIRELKELLGFDLDGIREVLTGEDRLAELRSAYSRDAPPEEQREILLEATRINARLRAAVAARLERMARFQGELEEKSQRYREVLAELDGGGGRAQRR